MYVNDVDSLRFETLVAKNCSTRTKSIFDAEDLKPVVDVPECIPIRISFGPIPSNGRESLFVRRRARTDFLPYLM